MLFAGLFAPYWTLQVRSVVTSTYCVCSAPLITSRIRIALKLRGQQVVFQTLPGVFEVAHLDKKLLERDLRSTKGPFKFLLYCIHFTVELIQ